MSLDCFLTDLVLLYRGYHYIGYDMVESHFPGGIYTSNSKYTPKEKMFCKKNNNSHVLYFFNNFPGGTKDCAPSISGLHIGRVINLHKNILKPYKDRNIQ